MHLTPPAVDPVLVKPLPICATAQEFVESLSFVYPIVFESGDDTIPYYCGGSCFAVTLHDRLFIVTAKHCLTGRDDEPCIMGPDRRLFPIKQPVDPICDDEDNDWSDITCISTYGREHWPALCRVNTVDIGVYLQRQITADRGAFLALKGYPACHTEVDPPNILRKPSFHLGMYGGPTNDSHCHYFHVVYPPILDPDGLSGAPVVMMDYAPGHGVFPTLLGVVTRGAIGTQFLRFIGIDVVMRVILKLHQEA
jgi:hypothetical protein